jgi:hypothetical protein
VVTPRCKSHVCDSSGSALIHTSEWRYWGCVTGRQLEHLLDKFDGPSDLDGYEDLSEADWAKISKARADGHVADEDVPGSARKTEEEAGNDGEVPLVLRLVDV